MTQPLVSVIIPAYNAEKWLGEAVRSVLAQTLTEWELIIVNDGSSDGTSDVARAFGDERILVMEKPNNGVSSARNCGLEQATGDCIAFLDADDAMEPSNLDEKYEILRKGDVEWVFGDLLLCDPDMGSLHRILKGTEGDVVRTILLGVESAVPASCSNALLKRSCFDSGFRFDPELSNAADQHFSLFMAQHFRYRHLPKALNKYRVLTDSMSRNVDLYAADHIRLIGKAEGMGLLHDPELARQVWSNAYWSIGGSYWRNAQTPMKSIPYFFRAVFRDPRVLLRRVQRT